MSRIDGREFARSRGHLSGQLLAHDAPRLEELGWRVEAIDFALRGRSDEHGRLYLDLEAAGTLTSTCQRCLQSLQHELRFARELELADSVAQIETADDDMDRVLASSSMDVGTLVEDEVILELPMVGKHEGCDPLQEARPDSSVEEDRAGLKGVLLEWARRGRTS